MGIYNTRNPVVVTTQWMANGYVTSNVTVPNTATDVVTAVAGSTTPRFLFITVDALVANAAPVYILLGTGVVSATNYSFVLEPGITLETQIMGEKISALSTTANAQTVRLAIANGVKA